MTQSITNYAVATVAAFALVLAFAATPASASMNSSSIKILVDNSGSIDNTTKAKAETGGNWAGGSKGGRGGSGGDVEVENGGGDYNNGGADAGNGGNGANASAGGLVTTGDANADAGTVNSLNTTDVEVDLYGEDMNSSKIKLDVDNDQGCDCENNIDNTTRARARTGGNDADGSKGGSGGSGGDVEAEDGDNNNGGASAGHGGHGGTGGIGGEVWTGEATANAGTVNVLNAVLARVLL